MWNETLAHLRDHQHLFELDVRHPTGWHTHYRPSHDTIVFLCSCGLRHEAGRSALPPDVMDLTRGGMKRELVKRVAYTAYGYILGDMPDESRETVHQNWIKVSRQHASHAHRKVAKLMLQVKEDRVVHRCSCGWTNVLYREQYGKPEWDRMMRHAKRDLGTLLHDAMFVKAGTTIEGSHVRWLLEDETVQPR